MQIAPGLYSMSQTAGGRVHAFLIDDGIDLTLIDTLYDDNAHVIFEELKTIGKQPIDIRRILLTHSHKSHLGGLEAIAAASNAAIYAHEAEIPIVQGERKAKPVGWRLPHPFNLEVYGLQTALNLGVGSHQPCIVQERLQDGMKVGPVECIGAPGHTSGCIAFWWPERKALIAGDTVASWPVVDVGWPSFNLNQWQATRSVGKMSELPCEVLCVGHGEPILHNAKGVLKKLSFRL